MKLIDFDRIDDEHLKNIIAVLKTTLKRKGKNAVTGKPREINETLLQVYQEEQERRKTKTDGIQQ